LYLKLAKRQGEVVLELACGTALLTVPIAVTGLSTVGLDLSGSMLEAAKRRAATAGVLLSTDDLLTCFASVKRHLSSTGIFVFDVFNPDVEILARQTDQRFPLWKSRQSGMAHFAWKAPIEYDAATQISHGTSYVSTEDQQDNGSADHSAVSLSTRTSVATGEGWV
jgi:predicted TPR repeat methyltransferase